LKQVSGKDFAKLLSQKGWELKKIHGSHHVYTKAESRNKRFLAALGMTFVLLKGGIWLF